MRTSAVLAVLLIFAVSAQVARAQHVAPPDGGGDASRDVARPGPLASYLDRADAAPPAAADASAEGAEAAAPAAREPCAEALHAVQFEDPAGAERGYAACRARVARPGRIPVADDLRALEDVTEALHGLRRTDGEFCVAPSAPFEFGPLLAGASDTRACFAALDRFLSSDNAVWRFALADAYASGRLASRAGYDVVTARRTRRRPNADSAAERELLAVARLAGRHFMRTCRCLPGPQPDSVTSVRGMHLPSTVESVLLEGLAERGEAPVEP